MENLFIFIENMRAYLLMLCPMPWRPTVLGKVEFAIRDYIIRILTCFVSYRKI